MAPLVLTVLLMGGLALLGWAWFPRLRRLWVATTTARAMSGSNPSPGAEEQVTEAQLAFFREVFILVVMAGAASYVIIALLLPATGEMLHLSPSGLIASPLREGERLTMDALLLFALGSTVFLITFGLCWAFLPGLFPWEKESRTSRILSLLIAICLALTVSLYVASTPESYTALLGQITGPISGLVSQFISVLVGAIGIYLAWKQIQRLIKPK